MRHLLLRNEIFFHCYALKLKIQINSATERIPGVHNSYQSRFLIIFSAYSLAQKTHSLTCSSFHFFVTQSFFIHSYSKYFFFYARYSTNIYYTTNTIRYINRQGRHYITYKVNCFHKYTGYGVLQPLIPLYGDDPSPLKVG